ncbi:MAG: mechanosensitive ion channel family protein [Immundisolibacteraceae bacterium]|nr:mechanosensitive ion channel family protein [Immundisolibacteraceae bacterium]
MVLLLLLAGYLQRRVFTKIFEKAKLTRNPWDDAVVQALQRPLTWLIWGVGLLVALQIVAAETELDLMSDLVPLRDLTVISLLIWFLLRLITAIEKNILDPDLDTGETLDETTWGAISKLLRTSVFITGVLVVLQTMGISVSGVLAFGGVGGIAVGFAARDLLANFFGGLIIYMDKPFRVGDWVRSPDRNIEGTVEDIGWRLTRIRTFDKRPLYIPNSVFATIVLENPSRMTNRRINETIGVRYDDIEQLPTILKNIEVMLKEHSDIDTRQTLMVNFNTFGSSSVDFFVYTFTKTTDWVKFHQIKEDVLLKIAAIIEAEGGEIAFPTRTIHVADSSIPVALTEEVVD